MFFIFSCCFHCRYNLKKLTYEERKAKLVERLNALNASAGADEIDDDEDDDEASLVFVGLSEPILFCGILLSPHFNLLIIQPI